MSDQPSDFPLLSAEQLSALTSEQKEIFRQLDEADRQFFAKNFSPASLGKALERKAEMLSLHEDQEAIERRARECLDSRRLDPQDAQPISTGEVPIGAAGAAGIAGLSSLARKIPPAGTASWLGVTPRNLIPPLIAAFHRQESADIQFMPPTLQGLEQGSILLRTPQGPVPVLSIVLTPLGEATQVKIVKTVSEGGGQVRKRDCLGLTELLTDGLRYGKAGVVGDLRALASQAVSPADIDVASAVKHLNLEEKAWEIVQETAGALQAIYYQKQSLEKERRLRLETSWDEYYACPKCRVEFGAGDQECRICGAARPSQPTRLDPRRV